MPLDSFHPSVSGWFRKTFAAPTEPQERGWPSIKSRNHTLIAAPTGSGKTLAAFLSAIDDLVRLGVEGKLEDHTHVVYVSPLKALSNDIERNLRQPLAGVKAELAELGFPQVEIRVAVRTGDTTSSARSRMTKRPPHIVVTTPESLYILLTSDGGRRMLSTTRTVIVDEIHAVVANKRGSHLALSLERLAALVAEQPGSELLRVGLSATQRPIERVGQFLVGGDGEAPENGRPPSTIVDAGHSRPLDLAVEVPSSPLEAVMPAEVWEEIYDRLAALVSAHRTTLVFVNTRRLAERAARHLGDRLGEDKVASHHGSLAKEQRLSAEQRLKAGELRVLVATASLELGIDIGVVDLVCQLGTTRSIAALLQRVGRSGHALGGLPKGRLFPLSRDELVECAALLLAVRHNELDALLIPECALDILAQQIVAEVACREWGEAELFERFRRAFPYRALTRADFDAVVEMLAGGFSTRRGRRGAHIHYDAVNGRIRGRRGARLAALTSGGAIPDNADYDVVLEPTDTIVGSLNEDFAIESMPGDIFQLGNTSWLITKVEPGRVRVMDAKGQPPTIPFWLGEAPSRTAELSQSVSEVRTAVAERVDLEGGEDGELDLTPATHWLVEEVGLPAAGAEQVAEYLAAARAALGVMPSQEALVLERFFDESGGMQLVLHSPFGSRLNRAWGLALRKRFCKSFNFELQAAATEDAILLSLGHTHSFPVEDVFAFLHSNTVRDVLVQALLDAPMFPTRWRWNASRALAVLRWRSGKRVPPRFQRMDADDLVAVVFPDQLACLENIQGEREIPDHPLIGQTIRDCLEEAMDIDALETLLRAMERGEKRLVARDLHEPSPMAHEILNARPYAFLDDAPLEERRTQAVMSRRWIDPKTAAELGALDASAIERVRSEAWPTPSDADELHDALVVTGLVTNDEARSESSWPPLLQTLVEQKRAAVLSAGDSPAALWVAAERLPELMAVYPDASLEPPLQPPERYRQQEWDPDEALVELLRGRLEACGPTTAAELAHVTGLKPSRIEGALLELERQGTVFRGQFTPGSSATEWCERRLLARIHRYTIDRLRKEIAPVSRAELMGFLLKWQRMDAQSRAEGPEALPALLRQLEGFEVAAGAWESEILPARIADYDPSWLDALCLSGQFTWCRLRAPTSSGRSSRGGPIRSTPIALLRRAHRGDWMALAEGGQERIDLSSRAATVLTLLSERGASFFAEVVEIAGLLRTEVEEALAELVAAGAVTADSFTGLRALLTPSDRRAGRRGGRGFSRRGAVGSVFGMENAGRWSLLRPEDRTLPAERRGFDPAHLERVETAARVLLRRYGVVFRRLLERESVAPPWRDLLRVYRRLEARGEVRGGRFVTGFSGEQFALPEAVGALRKVRRDKPDGALVSVSGVDPLNLVGIAVPGERVSAVSSNRVLFRDGIPIAVLEAGEVRFLAELAPTEQWEAHTALVRRRVPVAIQPQLGHRH